MATSITYGSYSFPEPIPIFSEEDAPVILEGSYDHSAIRINLVGYLTGSDLSGLHLQKMQMISGFLNEYQDLNVTVENQSKTCPKAFVESIDFADSDLTTFLPYSLTALYYSGESFSEYHKVTEPTNSWSYSEGDKKIITATHEVSAKGLKVDSSSAFDNAKEFVTGKLSGGFQDVSLFNKGGTPFLTSRTENIDRKSDIYGVTEVYSYSSSDRPLSDSGIVDVSTSISYGVNQELSVSVQGSIQGSIDSNTGAQVGLLTTGNFTAEQATDVAINALVNSYSDYESGVYSFVSNGPSTFSYDIDTGANSIGFSFSFLDSENLDIINEDVVHKHSTSIALSKDSAITSVSVNGSLSYQGVLAISSTGEFEQNARFQAVDSAFSSVDPYYIARSSIDDFTGVATGYEFNSSYLNPEPLSFNITKNPIDNILTYNYSYSNSIDFSSGSLNNLKISIKDKKPLQINSVQETLSGFQASQVISRSLGQYSISTQSDNPSSDLGKLKEIASGYCSGSHILSESFSTGQNTINYNLSKYY